MIGANFFKGFDDKDQDERYVGLSILKKEQFKVKDRNTPAEYIREIPAHLALQEGFNYEVRE